MALGFKRVGQPLGYKRVGNNLSYRVVGEPLGYEVIEEDDPVPPKDGRDGKDGERGATGPSGPAGRDGKDGAGLNWTGVYKPSQTYSVNDLVEYLGSSYIAVAPSQNKPPNQSRQFWNLFSAAGASGANGPKGDPGPTTGVPTFIQKTEPDHEGSYVWVQTGLGESGCDYSVWYKICEESNT
jgi:hypothetical protein